MNRVQYLRGQMIESLYMLIWVCVICCETRQTPWSLWGSLLLGTGPTGVALCWVLGPTGPGEGVKFVSKFRRCLADWTTSELSPCQKYNNGAVRQRSYTIHHILKNPRIVSQAQSLCQLKSIKDNVNMNILHVHKCLKWRAIHNKSTMDFTWQLTGL